MSEPTFTYNMRVEIEKVSKLFITQVEVSNYGRVKRIVLRTETFDDAVKQINEFREKTFAEIEAFLAPPAEAPAPKLEVEQPAMKPGEPEHLKVAPAGPEKTPEEIAAENNAAVAAVAAVQAAKEGTKPGSKPKVVKPKKEERQFAAT